MGQEHTHDSTIQLLKDAHSLRNFEWPPEAHWKSTNEHNKSSTLLTAPQRHSMTFHHNPTTVTQLTFCMGWGKPPHNQRPFTHWQSLLQPECYRWALNLINWLNQLGGLQQTSQEWLPVAKLTSTVFPSSSWLHSCILRPHPHNLLILILVITCHQAVPYLSFFFFFLRQYNLYSYC